MIQKLIIFVVVAGAAAYLFFRLRRSFKQPDCSCGDGKECPFAGGGNKKAACDEMDECKRK